MKNNNFSNSNTGLFVFTFSRWIHSFLCVAFLLVGSALVQASEGLTLGWDPNPESDHIAGYRLRYGTTAGVYSVTMDLGNSTTASVVDLDPGKTYYFVVSAYNSAEVEGLPSEEFSTIYEPTQEDADGDSLPDEWEAAHGFSQLSSDLTGTDGDPDGDNLSNLAEYAMNLDPTAPQGPSATPVSIQLNEDGKRYLTLSYQRRIYAPGIVFTVEATGNFPAWSSGSHTVEQIGTPIQNPDGLTELVSVRILPALEDNGTPTQVVRLRVSKLP